MSAPKVGSSAQHHAQHVAPKTTPHAPAHASTHSGAEHHAANSSGNAAAINHVVSQFNSSAVKASSAHVSAAGRRLDADVQRARTNAHLSHEAAAAHAHAAQAARVTLHNGIRTTERVLGRTSDATFIQRTTRVPGKDPVERYIIDARGGNDTIRIERNRGRDARESPLIVSINGHKYSVPRAAADMLSIRAGQGNDRIIVGKGVQISLTLEGGRGNDRIIGGAGSDHIEGGRGNDTVYGAGGRDYINGSLGNDRLIGGDGSDTVYGGDGRDRIGGGQGNDYLEGSRGNDQLSGGIGRDVVSGGRGDDVLGGGAQRDVMYAGVGRDRINSGTGRDNVYVEAGVDRGRLAGDRVFKVEIISTLGTAGIHIDPHASSEFRERAQADLDMLRSSRVGQEMLRQLDQAAQSPDRARRHSVTLAELPDLQGGQTIPRHGDKSIYLRANRDGTGRPNLGDDSTVLYNPSFNPVPPMVVLYHEMTHAYNNATGTTQRGIFHSNNRHEIDNTAIRGKGVNRSERQAVGLPNGGRVFDNDNDPSTPLSSDNPAKLNENAMRRELGVPLRKHYASHRLPKRS